MNRTSIDWAQYSWNPVTGCQHGCDYCYARRMAQRFTPKETDNWNDCTQPGNGLHEIRHMVSTGGAWKYGFAPTLHSARLSEPLWVKKPSRVFVCSMADLFGDWVPNEWIYQVLAACEAAPQHQYLFLTKNPERYNRIFKERLFLGNEKIKPHANWWLGATFGTAIDTIYSRVHLLTLHEEGWHTWVSAEPLLEDITPYWAHWEDTIDWLVIGAMTGPGSKNRQPEFKWIESLADGAIVRGIPVFLKQSLASFYWPIGLVQQYPKAIQRLDSMPAYQQDGIQP